MSLGIGLFASVVLILLVYNKPFRVVFGKFALVLGVLLGIGAIVYGCYIAWDIHEEHVKERAIAAQTPVYLDDQGNPKPPASDPWKALGAIPVPAVIPPPGYTLEPPVIQIHGGETLKVVKTAPNPTSPKGSTEVPTIYFGHHQTIMVLCGNFGEKSTTGATNKNGEVTCP